MIYTLENIEEYFEVTRYILVIQTRTIIHPRCLNCVEEGVSMCTCGYIVWRT